MLLFIAIFPSAIYAEGSYTFIGKPSQLTQRAAATVCYIGERNICSEQTIFLEFNNIVIKIFGNIYTNIEVGDQIVGYFNKPNSQEFYLVRTNEFFDGQVLCKRIPKRFLPTINENNTHISGNNNTYSNNKTIKSNNNISRNNVYIAGDNNTITGNTHKQGSNNVYENNIVIGGSNNHISNTNTEGASNQIVQGQVIDKSGSGSSSSSGSSGSSGGGGTYHLNSNPYHVDTTPTNYIAILKYISIAALFTIIARFFRKRGESLEVFYGISLMSLCVLIWILFFNIISDYLPYYFAFIYLGLTLCLLSVVFENLCLLFLALGFLSVLYGVFGLILKYPIFLLFVFGAVILFYLYHYFKKNTNKSDSRESTYQFISPPPPPTTTTYTPTSAKIKKPFPPPLPTTKPKEIKPQYTPIPKPKPQYVSNKDNQIKQNSSSSIVPKVVEPKNSNNAKKTSRENQKTLETHVEKTIEQSIEHKEVKSFSTSLIGMPLFNKKIVLANLSLGESLRIQKVKYDLRLKVIDDRGNNLGYIPNDITEKILPYIEKGGSYTCTVLAKKVSNINVLITKEKMQPSWERKAVSFEHGYIGCKASKILHSILCSDAEMIKESNRIFLKEGMKRLP